MEPEGSLTPSLHRTPRLPKLPSGTVSDGDKGIDPETINNSAEIEITFSEDVTGNIALQTAAGVDVGWLGKVDGTKGVLELVKGKELGNEINYVIAGKVSDAAGNETDLKIRFTTASKPPAFRLRLPMQHLIPLCSDQLYPPWLSSKRTGDRPVKRWCQLSPKLP